MNEIEDWQPGENEKSEAEEEHARLLKEIKLAEKKRDKIDKKYAGSSELDIEKRTSQAFEILFKEDDLSSFYDQHPEFDPKNERWPQEFRELGQRCDLNPGWDWLKKSTWTTSEAINLVCGYRAERPQSLFDARHKEKLQWLEVDLFVKIHPVNPNVPPDQFRFKPTDFVTWLEESRSGCVPSQLESLCTLTELDWNAPQEDVGSVSKQAAWREVQREEHRAAIKYVLDHWPEECVGKRGDITADATSVAFDNHVVQLERVFQFSHEVLSNKVIAKLARRVIDGENSE